MTALQIRHVKRAVEHSMMLETHWRLAQSTGFHQGTRRQHKETRAVAFAEPQMIVLLAYLHAAEQLLLLAVRSEAPVKLATGSQEVFPIHQYRGISLSRWSLELPSWFQ